MTLFEPFSPLFELTRDMSRWTNGRVVPSFLPAADVVVTDDDVTVTMDVPGLKSGDVEIELVDDVLTVRGERPLPFQPDAAEHNGNGNGAWRRIERGFGKFERVLRVPQGLSAEQIGAELVDGVLTLHIAKPEAHKPHRIQITTGGSEAIEGSATEQRELAGATA